MRERKKLVITKEQITELKRKSIGIGIRSATSSIFGNASLLERTKSRKHVNAYIKRERAFAANGLKPWPVSDTPIRDYFRGVHEKPIDEYILGKIKEAKAQGRKFKVLDIGIGNGMSWTAFFKQHELVNGVDVEVFGTVLARSALAKTAKPYFLNRLRSSTAVNLANRFSDHLESFDLILSRIGTYGHQLNAIENAHALLKSGGEIITSQGIADRFRSQLSKRFEVKYWPGHYVKR